MIDEYDNIRAERDHPLPRANVRAGFAGLWKQIALGIVVGYSVLSMMGVLIWFMATNALTGVLALGIPH